MKISIITILIGALLTPMQSQGQSDLFNSIKKDNILDAELYFYASTLRMINIKRNPGFDELVNGIDKLKFFKVADLDRKEIRELANKFYTEEGYEEMVVIDGKEEVVHVMAREDDEYIALMADERGMIAVELIGNIGVHKIPELINTLNEGDLLDVFEVGREERLEHARESKDN
ncbi:MAG: DUF4252 domain-containing protein [Cyclobacteriaceae bacterium]